MVYFFVCLNVILKIIPLQVLGFGVIYKKFGAFIIMGIGFQVVFNLWFLKIPKPPFVRIIGGFSFILVIKFKIQNPKSNVQVLGFGSKIQNSQVAIICGFAHKVFHPLNHESSKFPWSFKLLFNMYMWFFFQNPKSI